MIDASRRNPVGVRAIGATPSRGRPDIASARSRRRSGPVGYVWGIAAVAVGHALSALLAPYVQLSGLVMINLVAVVGISMRFGIGPSLATAALTALGFDFFFIPPKFALAPEDLEGGVTLVVMVVVAGVISGLGEQTRRQRAAAQARELQMETERLRSSLLSAVSHDLRTPLAAILGAGTEPLQDGATLDAAERDGLAETIVEEAARLDQLVTNLLDVARLDEGAVQVRKRLEPLEEVVEDALGRATLVHNGYEITEAVDGMQALGQVTWREPHLVLLDLGLPDIDGIDIVARVRETSGVPIIVISAREAEQAKIRALDLGANDYVTKPFGAGELLARIRVALRLGPPVRDSAPAAVLSVGDLHIDFSLAIRNRCPPATGALGRGPSHRFLRTRRALGGRRDPSHQDRIWPSRGPRGMRAASSATESS